MSDDVAIVGIGMHAFGRHEGVTGMEQGAVAIRKACTDAGIEWGDLQFAFGGALYDWSDWRSSSSKYHHYFHVNRTDP